MDQGRRKDRDTESPDTPEGVRILGADEAAEALERSDVAHRRTGDQLRYGDRPPGPPEDVPRPVLRFPLGSADDPRDIERTPVAEGPGRDEADDTDHVDAVGPREEDLEDDDGVPEISGPVELPHWTDPPTGQVPSLLGGETDEGDDLDDWASFASSAPRWRDDASGYGEHDDLDDLLEEGSPLGALDDSERPSHDEYLSFADLDEGVPPGRSVFADAEEADPGEDEGIGAGWGDEDLEEEPEPFAELDEERPIPPVRRPRPRRAAPLDDGAPPAERDMGLAVVVGVGLLALALFLFSIGPAAAMILVTAVIGLAAAELFTALRHAGFQPVVLAGLSGTVGMVLGAYHYGPGAISTVLVLTTVVCLLWYLVGAGGDSPVMNTGVTLGAVLWVGMFGSFAALMLNLGDPGVGILLAAILGTVGYDVGGLFIGKQAGRQPLSAASPNKTVEGLLGGCLVAAVVVIIGAVSVGFGPIDTFGQAHDQALAEGVSVGFGPIDTFGQGLVVGLAVAIAAPLGDLCESLVKRDLGVKDMGSILPGHGGLLDRFDGLLFVLPTVYLLASVSDFFVS